MKKIWKNYKTMIILVLSMIIGAICGLIFKEKAAIVKPFGDLFLNLMFVIIAPLIFLTITLAVAKIKQPKRLGNEMDRNRLCYNIHYYRFTWIFIH